MRRVFLTALLLAVASLFSIAKAQSGYSLAPTKDPDYMYDKSNQWENEEPTVSTNTVGDPVRQQSGSFSYQDVDLRVPSPNFDFVLTRHYRSRAHEYESWMGSHWDHSYNKRLILKLNFDAPTPADPQTADPDSQQSAGSGEGRVVETDDGTGTSGGQGISEEWWQSQGYLETAHLYFLEGNTAMEQLKLNFDTGVWEAPGNQPYRVFTTELVGPDTAGGWVVENLPLRITVRTKDGWEMLYTLGDTACAAKPWLTYNITRIRDRHGATMSFEYDNLDVQEAALLWVTDFWTCEADGIAVSRLTRVWDTLGRPIDFRYDEDRLSEVEDYLGNKVQYFYDSKGRLEAVERPATILEPNTAPVVARTEYRYGSQDPNYSGDEYREYFLEQVIAPNQVADGSLTPYVQNDFTDNGRVLSQEFGGTDVSGFVAGGRFDFFYEIIQPEDATDGWFFETKRMMTVDPNGAVQLTFFGNLGGAALTANLGGYLGRNAAGKVVDGSGQVIVDIADAVSWNVVDDANLSASLIDPVIAPMTDSYAGAQSTAFTRRYFEGGVFVREATSTYDKHLFYSGDSWDEWQKANLIGVEWREPQADGYGATVRKVAYAYEPIFGQLAAFYAPEYFDPATTGDASRFIGRMYFDYQEIDPFVGASGKVVREVNLGTFGSPVVIGTELVSPIDVAQDAMKDALVDFGVASGDVYRVFDQHGLGDQNGDGVFPDMRHFGSIVAITSRMSQWADDPGQVVPLSVLGNGNTGVERVIQYNAFGKQKQIEHPHGVIEKKYYSSVNAGAGIDGAPYSVFPSAPVLTGTPPALWSGYPASWPVRDLDVGNADGGGFLVESGFAPASGGSVEQKVTRTYSGPGYLASEEDARGAKWSYVRNQSGRIIEHHSPNGEVKRTSYDHNLWPVHFETDVYCPVEDQNRRPMPGQAFQYTREVDVEHDLLGRMIKHTRSSGADQFAWAGTGSNSDDASADLITQYRYDKGGRLVLQANPEFEGASGQKSSIVTWTYNAMGRLHERSMGGATALWESLPGNERILAEQTGGSSSLDGWTNHAELATYRYRYNQAGLETEYTDARGNSSHMEYDFSGGLKSTLSPDGVRTEWDRNLMGRPVEKRVYETDPLYGLDTLVRHLRYQVDELGRIIEAEEKVIDPLNASPSSGIASPGDAWRTRRYRFSETGQLLAEQDDHGEVWRYTYNDLGLRDSRTDPLGNVTRYEYDLAGNVQKVTLEEVTEAGPPLIREFWSFHDLEGNVTATADWFGRATRNCWDSEGRLVYTADAKASMSATIADLDAYGDHVGLPALSVSAPGNGTWFNYDHRGLLWSTERIARAGGSGDGALQTSEHIELRNRWSRNNLLTAQIDALGNETQHTYDDLGRLNSILHASQVYLDYSQFDLDGNPTQWTTSNGVVVSQTYDAKSRPLATTATLPAATSIEGVTTRSFQYDAFGRVTYASNPSTTVQRQYDSLGRMVEEQNGPFLTLATYDDANRTSTLHYDSGRQAKRTYDELGRLSTVHADDLFGMPDQLLATYGYEGFDRQVSRENHLTNTVWELDYGTDGFVSHSRHENLSTGFVHQETSTSYDANGNRTTLGDSRFPESLALFYDSFDRLVRSEYEDAGVVTDFSEYDLDKANNRVAVLGSVDPGSYSTVGQGQDQNQYSETPFDLRGYDDAGNLVSIADPLAPGASTSVETRGLYYDYLDRLVRVDDSENAREHVYAYDALGRRISKTVDVQLGGTRTDFVHFGDQVLEERDSLGLVLRSFVYGRDIDEPLSMRTDVEADGTIDDVFYRTDDQYNVLETVDSNGQPYEGYRYKDFGSVTKAATGLPLTESQVGNPYLFNGRRYDEETGYYYARNRYYEPRTGRLLTKDPIGIWADFSAMGNGYTWCGNNPWSHRDPYGTIPWRNWGCSEWTTAAKCVGSGALDELIDALDFSWTWKLWGQLKETIEGLQDALAEFDRQVREEGLGSVLVDVAKDQSPTVCLLLEGCCLDPCEFGTKVGGAALEIGGALVTGGTALGLKINRVLNHLRWKQRQDRRDNDNKDSDKPGSEHGDKEDGGDPDPDRRSGSGEGDDDSSSVGEGSTEGGGCLAGDTLVVMGDGSTKPISEIQVGDRVLPTMLSELPPVERGGEDWYRVDLEVDQSRRGWARGTHVSLLVSKGEIGPWRMRGDQRFYLSNFLAEIEGWARVGGILPVDVSRGGGRLVLATYKSFSRDVLRLRVSDGSELRITSGHPLLDIEGRWVAAGHCLGGTQLWSILAKDGCSVAQSSVEEVSLAEGEVHDLQIDGDCSFILESGLVCHNAPGGRPCDDEDLGPNRSDDFDTAREKAFEHAGMTDPDKVEFSKYDPETGTVVEFKGEGGAKVAYDPPHRDMNEEKFHDVPHVGSQTSGKRGSGGASRQNFPYTGPQHPSRPDTKD